MRISLVLLSLVLCLGVGYRAWSEDKHDHGKQEKKKDEHGHDHGEEEHAEEEGHSHAPDEKKGEEGHSHAPSEKGEEKGHDHAVGEAGHAESDEHGHAEGGGGHEEEGGGVVGPEKGIVEKGPLGIKLSEEAVKTINPETVSWQSGSITIPYQGLVRIKDTKSVYRVRNGFFKRVPAVVQSRQGDRVTVSVAGLEAGDKIVISQAGFLRIAEVITEEGASHGHSH